MAAKATFVQNGDAIDYTPSSAVAQGDVVVLSGGTAGKITGVAVRDIAANATGALQVRGIFDFVKASADAFAIGEKVYWHTTNLNVVLSATGATLLGNAVEVKGAGTTTCKVSIPFQGL